MFALSQQPAIQSRNAVGLGRPSDSEFVPQKAGGGSVSQDELRTYCKSNEKYEMKHSALYSGMGGAKMRFNGGVVWLSSVRSVTKILLPAKLMALYPHIYYFDVRAS